MRTLQVLLFVLAVCAFGCKTDPNQVLLERDLRLQEDRIYELEAMLDDACAARESTMRENQALKKELSAGDQGAASDYRSPAAIPPAGSSPPERRPRREDSPKLEPPTIELPEPTTEPPVELPGGKQSAIIGDGPPTQLVINKRLTGGLDRGAEPGDEGIMVAVEPRDAAGRLVKSPGAVSVVVLDPTLEGEAGRVARWDFESDEVPSYFRTTGFARGLQFELPWPSTPPQNRDLRLFVRFTTPEGRKIVTESPIRVRTAEEPPVADRKTKDKSIARQSDPPQRKPHPASRLKSPRVALSEPRDIQPADQDDAPAEVAAEERGDPRDRDAAGAEAPDAGAPDAEMAAERDPREAHSAPIDRDSREELDDREPDAERTSHAERAPREEAEPRATRPRRTPPPRSARAERPEWKPYR